MPDESVVKQLLFAEGLVGLGGVVGRPRSTWRDRAVAALRPVLTPQLAAPGPLLDPRCLAALNTVIPFMGPLPRAGRRHERNASACGLDPPYAKPTLPTRTRELGAEHQPYPATWSVGCRPLHPVPPGL
eukprot:357557-Chlamydomonas_euryale.AAC.5